MDIDIARAELRYRAARIKRDIVDRRAEAGLRRRKKYDALFR